MYTVIGFMFPGQDPGQFPLDTQMPGFWSPYRHAEFLFYSETGITNTYLAASLMVLLCQMLSSLTVAAVAVVILMRTSVVEQSSLGRVTSKYIYTIPNTPFLPVAGRRLDRS